MADSCSCLPASYTPNSGGFDPLLTRVRSRRLMCIERRRSKKVNAFPDSVGRQDEQMHGQSTPSLRDYAGYHAIRPHKNSFPTFPVYGSGDDVNLQGRQRNNNPPSSPFCFQHHMVYARSDIALGIQTYISHNSIKTLIAS